MPPRPRFTASLNSSSLLCSSTKSSSVCHRNCLTANRHQARNASAMNAMNERATKGMAKIPAQESYKSRTKNISEKDIPTDLGLLPDLFIFPRTNGAAPKWFSKDVSKRFKLELFYLREQAKAILALWMELRYNRPPDNRIPLAVVSRSPNTRILHQSMYTAISTGNAALLNRICCDTLASKLRTQIDRRSRISTTTNNIDSQWRLEKYLGPVPLPPTLITEKKWLRRMTWWLFPLSALYHYLVPGVYMKVVSDRAAGVPLGQNTVIRQVVVRIRSRQSVMRLKKSKHDIGTEGETERKSRDLTEYVVLQRMYMDGKERPWMIWGTVEEADEKAVEKLLEKGWTGANEEEKGKMASLMERARGAL